MDKDWVVLKFGGSSVAEPAHWKTIDQVVADKVASGQRPLLVLSALKNVSNALEALVHQSVAGVYPAAINQLKELHLGFASKLGLDCASELAPWFEQLSEDCQQIHTSGEVTPRMHARLLATGELLSTSIGFAYLQQKFEQQLRVHWLDARELLKSHDQLDPWHHFTSAECDFTTNPIQANALATKADIVVTQGFIAQDQAAQTVLLGREGSDTSAAYLAAIVDAKQVEIWTDVPGVFSANPRDLSNARVIKHLSYQQAELLAKAGAKVLHPRALAPVAANGLPIQVKCTGLPQADGTTISGTQMSLAGPVAITQEAEVTLFRYPLGQYQTQAVIDALMAIGFDLLFQYQYQEQGQAHEQQQWLIARYSNSDLPQPPDQQIPHQSGLELLSADSRFALVSLLGDSEDKTWQQQTLSSAQAIAGQENIVNGFESGPGLFSLVVAREVRDSLSADLHNSQIEARLPNSLLGESWQAFFVD